MFGHEDFQLEAHGDADSEAASLPRSTASSRKHQQTGAAAAC